MGVKRWNKGVGLGRYTVAHGKVPDYDAAPGWVSTNNEFLCACGSVIKNTKRDIKNHICKIHRVDSAYYKHELKPFLQREWRCPACSSQHGNFHAFLAHCRREHGFRGLSRFKEDAEDPNKPESTVQARFDQAVASGETAEMIAQRSRRAA
ncbi:hypothetical protein F5Y04DRAFT_280057 [Hypomontagnella monticulosa]|nr:hypothetical protein F5Y04DRAFT_280057 [Hypomontagnella monticulosa]